ncbi:MAG: helicase-exonuclease AddAB subunit AddA [Clostridiales bacterium]|nr:helicase-exonuclease AddAB subunit AddA [Clostridiales bacterium]
MRWTSEQRLAIEREGNLIVSAAAGAGKTAVLTERIVSRIRAGAPVESLLVLTFTRAAAAEMKGRIAKRLNELADEAGSADEMRYLRRQARGVDGAFISTIHAFCARVIRRHYHAVGLPARARTADEMESAALIETVRDELLTGLSADGDADYAAALAAFGGEQQVWDAVMATYRFTRAEPDPERWLADACARYADDAAIRRILDDAVVFCQNELSLAIETVVRERDALPPDCASAIATLDDELMRCRGMLLCKSHDQYREALAAMEYGRLTFPRSVGKEEKAPVQDARDAAKALIKEQQKRFLRPESEERNILRRSGEAVCALTALVRRFEQAYAEAKRGQNLLDYDDLEHYALLALNQDEIAREYREKFGWIAVDEYQDSNRVQEAILSRITRGDNLFFVGDVKQSIYRFRQAEPGLFLEKLRRFSGEAGARIDLSSNFRSSSEVIAAVNETFEAILSEQAGDIDYDERARLVRGAEQPEGGAELVLIDKERAGSEEDDDALEDAADMEVEARFIARRIHEILQNEVYIDARTGETRNYRYADVAVLLRAGTEAQALSQTLASCGVPAYAQSSGGYFDAVEVQIFRNLLSVIDNRRQDVPLISVLCSSIGGFTYEELARIRAAHPSGAFYEAFFACAEAGGALAGRAKAFLDKLSQYRAESRLVSVEELIGKLLDETGFYEEMGAGVSGEQRQANLNALLDKAHAFEGAGARGVWNFLRHLALAEDTASVGAAQTVTADVVRILTIHKSKGLEFPVVFVAGLGKRFNQTDVNNSLQLHAKYGMALRFIDRDGVQRLKRDTLARVILSQRVKREQLAEEMRVLYVAMTRARRKLILTACIGKPEEKYAAAPRVPTAWQAIKCSSAVRWLMMGAHRRLPVAFRAREAYLGGGAAREQAELPPYDPAVLEAIEQRLGWTYAHAEAARIAAKAAVSRVVRGEERLPEFQRPAFLGGETSAVFAGTATHAAMQHLPFARALDAGEVSAFLSVLVEGGKLTQAQMDAADAEAIAWFTREPLFLRMKEAARLERELPFSYPIGAEQLYGTAADEKVLLQGVLDACFLEDGGWTIVDYKTDRVRPGESAEQAALRHAGQLRLYAFALEALTGQSVRQMLVVLLSHRAVVRVS